jgi:hypothetical protein
MTLPPFDAGHGPEVFLLAGFIGQPSIASGLLHSAMAQQLLQTLQAHAGI